VCVCVCVVVSRAAQGDRGHQDPGGKHGCAAARVCAAAVPADTLPYVSRLRVPRSPTCVPIAPSGTPWCSHGHGRDHRSLCCFILPYGLKCLTPFIPHAAMDTDKIKIYGARVRVDSMAKVGGSLPLCKCREGEDALS